MFLNNEAAYQGLPFGKVGWAVLYIKPNSNAATSLIMLLSHGGVHVTATCTSFTPSISRKR